MSEPLVSIITPGHNGKDFVSRLLDSIINQTYNNIEFIYVDDGSTDGTYEILKTYEKRFRKRGYDFRLLRQKNSGVSEAINVGLKMIKGEYFCWPEYDDYFERDSIKIRVDFLEVNRDFGATLNDANIYIYPNYQKATGKLSDTLKDLNDEYKFEKMLYGESIFVAGCHMFRTESYKKVNKDMYIYPSKMGPNFQMLLPMYYEFKCKYIEKPLFNYVIRDESISHKKRGEDAQLLAMNEIENSILHTLGKIEMLDKEKKKYLKQISIMYNRKRFLFAWKHDDKYLLDQEYYKLKKEGRATFTLKVRFYSSKNFFMKKSIKLIEVLLIEVLYGKTKN